MRLFESGHLGSLRLANRIVRSASIECLCPEAHTVDPRYLALYERLARGGPGLIVTGNMFVHRLGIAQRNMLLLDDDGIIAPLSRVTAAAHRHGVPIVAQLNHGGRYCAPSLIGTVPLAPSPVREMVNRIVPRPMTEQDITEAIAAFVAAARRMREAGFDGVEINGSHGYLVNQFLSARTNRRRDRWGGTLANRARFLELIVEGIRRDAGSRYPLSVKLNGRDFAPGGVCPEEAVATAQRLEAAGVDGITVSGGIKERGLASTRGDVPTRIMLGGQRGVQRLAALAYLATIRRYARFSEGYFLEDAAALRRGVRIPVTAVGGFRRLEAMEAAVADGGVDFVALARPLVREPDLPARLRDGSASASACLNCNRCAAWTIMRWEPLRCHAVAS